MDKKLTRRALMRSTATCLLLSVSPIALAKRAAPQFIGVRIWPASAYTRLTVEASQRLEYTYFTIDNPRRLVIDIKGVTLNSVLQGLGSKVQGSDPYIAGIRAGQNTGDTVRIVIDLKAAVNPQVFGLNPVANFKHRLVVDLYPSVATDARDPLMALLADYSQGKINADADTPPPARQTGNRQVVVMLDPGHGGEDPGAIGPSGLREKDVVLSIARETKKRLDALGYKTYMTRNEDIFIPLGVRVAKARKLKADVFISIHADAFTSPSAKGTGVYALSTKGATSAAAKFLEQTQNNADLIGGVKTVGIRSVDTAIMDMTQTVTNRDSLVLAQKVLKELGNINTLHKGDVDRANFAVLRAPDIPSILVETAFISNPQEERMLSGSDFRQKCAQSICSGIQGYIKNAVLARG